jgi:hypothetical protein
MYKQRDTKDRQKHTYTVQTYRQTNIQTYTETDVQEQMYRWYKQTGRCTVSHINIIKDSGTDKQVEQTCQQTDKQKEKQTDRQRDQQPDRLNRDRQMYRCTNRHTDAWKDVKTNRRKVIQTCRQTYRQTKKKTANRQTDILGRHTYTHISTDRHKDAQIDRQTD